MASFLSNPIWFWAGWVILPILIEFIPAVGNFFLLFFKYLRNRKKQELNYMPEVSIIIPVYNSGKTLEACIRSVAELDYDISKLDVICIDNGSKDNSFEIFQRCQILYPKLALNWLKSAQGKSNALNMAIYNLEGKYIVNIDSDGEFEKSAVKNLVYKFETNKDCNCMTGAVLINPDLMDKEKGFLKILQKTEFLEYCQAFLAGRNFQAETNSIFTISGAFSAFRKSTLMKTRMYNAETICEDTQMTFQIKDNMKQKVLFCEDALFFVDPIESANKLYTQRQRWQIGELEVAKMFVLKKMRNPLNIIKDSSTRLMVFDHTMAFPKMAWIFVLAAICFSRTPINVGIMSLGFIYVMNIFTSYLFAIDTLCFLKPFPKVRDYYKRNIKYLILYPAYSYFTYIIRMCGILNSVGRSSSWKTNTFTEELKELRSQIKKDFNGG